MNVFKLQPGKEVGIIKNQIREAILDGEIANTRAEALQFMLKKGEEINLKPVNEPM
jgi:hypothetical protein